MNISKNILYMLSLLLVLILVGTYIINKGNMEHFQDPNIYYGVLPKDNHPTRIKNIIYYNDPIFITYSNKYVTLSTDKVIRTEKDALSQIVYLKPTGKINGLTPVSYMKELYLGVFPDSDYNKKFDKTFRIVPFSSNTSNSSNIPYLQINDIVSFKTIKEEYLCINSVSLELELINSTSPPSNSLFGIKNSPQCYTNYVKYGIDTRNTSIKTTQSILKTMKNVLDNKMKSISSNDNTIKLLRKKRSDLLEAIEKSKSDGNYTQNQMSISKLEHDENINNVKDKYSNVKLDVVKDFASKLIDAENAIDSAYLKEMKDLLDGGCANLLVK
jgi:hypothetical protein